MGAKVKRFRTVRDALDAEMAKPYVYGQSDCFFAGLAVAATLTGEDLRTLYAGAYDSLGGAQRALRGRGFDSVAALLATHFEQLGPLQARMGDLAVLDLAGAHHVAVCTGGMFRTKTPRGGEFHGHERCIAAFRVG